jgi:hypothetical protein
MSKLNNINACMYSLSFHFIDVIYFDVNQLTCFLPVT